MSLRRALETVAFKDSQPFRQRVFDYLAGHQPAVRLARRAYRGLRHGPLEALPLSTLFVGVYGLRAFLCLELPEGHRLVALGEYRNEERQFAWLEQVLGEPIGRARVGSELLGRPESLQALGRLVRQGAALAEAAALVRELDREHGDFLVGARVAATAGVYLRVAQRLQEHPLTAVLVSSDSNPLAMGAAWAARAAGRRTIYVTHGHIPDGPPRLDFDLSIVDGPAVLRVYDDSQGRAGAVVFKGAEGGYRPMHTSGLRADRPLVLGIFMSLIVDWARFAPLFDEIRAVLRPAKIILRLHPNQAIRDPRALDHLDLDDPALDVPVEVSLGETVLTDEAARCDLVLVGNSSAHLTLLRFGVPTACLAGMDLVPHDFYRFLRQRIVPELQRIEELDRAAIAAFYEDPAWAERFRDFDASYQREGCAQRVRQAMLEILEAS